MVSKSYRNLCDMRVAHLLPAVVISLSLASCDEQPPALSGELYLDLPAVPYKYNNLPDSLNGDFDDALPTLGRVLFYDRQLSLNNTVSCGSCHKQARGFADDVAFSRGYGNKRTTRNSMPIQNLRNHFFPAFSPSRSSTFMPGSPTGGTLFWDGREKNLQEMVLRPVVNHVEMGITDMDALADKLKQLTYYPDLFTDAFGDSDINRERIATALNSFVSSIESINTKLDQSFRLAQSSKPMFEPGTNPTSEVMLSDIEQKGFNLFLTKYDCNSCHQVQMPSGYLLFGGTFANIGLDAEYKDNGLSNVTKSGGDAGKFKIPSLRNVAVTGPYMHDGRFETLEEVVDHYSESIANHPNLDPRLRSQGKARKMDISPSEKEAIIAFLHTLTDNSLLTDPRFSDPFKLRAE
jgi:cytochrome c peroxidase